MKTKDKELIKENILIADFMGGEPINKVKSNPIAYAFPFEFGHKETWDEGGFQGSGKSSCWDIEDLQYNSSWEWLMPVIEKIESLGADFSIKCNKVVLHGFVQKKVEIYRWESDTIRSKMENTFEGVIEFIKWYNKIKWY